jgi:ABC-type multidrug transport system ATPase subunit
MSGGERARALFVVLSLSRPNFLILDEPTNHLDIDGKEQLEVQLLESGAALLVTAHDRRFLDTIAERFLRIDKGVVLEVPDPNEFYLTPEIRPTRPAREAPALEKSLEKSFEQNSDDVLARIVELEEKLDRDRARKRKFQKPALQIGWQAQLEQLYRQLEDD